MPEGLGDEQVASRKPSQLWEEFDKHVKETSTRRSVTTDATIEKQQYFQHKNLPRNEDPLEWWRVNSPHTFTPPARNSKEIFVHTWYISPS